MPLKTVLPDQMARKDILVTWLFGSPLLMLVTAVLSMLIWNYTTQAPQTMAEQPIHYLSGMAFQVPIGWFLSFLAPFGWVNIVFLGLSIFTKRCLLLSGSAVATILIGIFWPMTYVTMVGL